MEFELGKTYEELNLGDRATFTKTITETDVYLFAGISGDFNPVHLNEEFAKLTPFKTRIAHGALPQCLIAPVLGMKLPGLGTVAVEITTRFKKPTFFGDTVTAAAEVVEKLAAKKWIRLKLTWTNQRSELICTGEAVVIPPNPDFGKSAGATITKSATTLKKEEKKMAVTSVKEVFENMPKVFNAANAAGVDSTFQFHITGEGAGDWFVVVKDGTCQVSEGTHASPTVALTMAGPDWLAMINKELDGMTAFMSGKLKATGNIMAAQRIAQLFPF
jgi:acyl dehydratase